MLAKILLACNNVLCFICGTRERNGVGFCLLGKLSTFAYEEMGWGFCLHGKLESCQYGEDNETLHGPVRSFVEVCGLFSTGYKQLTKKKKDINSFSTTITQF